MKNLNGAAWPLVLLAFLAPIIGGQVRLSAAPSDGSLLDWFGSPAAPIGTLALFGHLACVSLAGAVGGRRVVQIPALRIGPVVVLLVVATGLAAFVSAFPYRSYVAWLSWVVYALVLAATVATAGRARGAQALVWAMVAGGAGVALHAVQEYGAARALDPNWRVFGGWNNPNGLAGMLAMLFPVTVGLALSRAKFAPLAAGLAGGLMAFALFLTQSKGGIISCGIATLTTLVAAGLWGHWKRLGRAAIPIGLAGLLVVAVAFGGGATKGPGSRLADSGSTQEQSQGFRQLLWKSAVELAASRPQGWGLDSFQFESARPGHVEQTVHAHQTYLQLAAEGGVWSLGLLLFLFCSWLVVFLSRARSWPAEQAGWRAAILGGCVAAAADGLVESNLIYSGSGVILFMLMGLGLQLSFDGSTPEALPRKVRGGVLIALVALPCLLLLGAATVESAKSHALAHPPSARQDLQLARALAPQDGESLALSASLVPGSATDQLAQLYSAAQAEPSTRNLRTYARFALAAGKNVEASQAVERALVRDPNNLIALKLKYEMLEAFGHHDRALATARALVAVRGTSPWKVRAIPDLVPLEMPDAEVFVAARETDPKSRAALLEGAVSDYSAFMSRTAPLIEKFTNEGQGAKYLGLDRTDIANAKSHGLKAYEELKTLYRSAGDTAGLSRLESVSAALRED